MFWILFIFFVIHFICWNTISRYNTWLKKGVKQTKYGFICGDQWSIIFRQHNFGEMLQHIYNMFPNTRYTGFHLWFQPILLIKDHELVEKVLKTNFNHFVNHSDFFPKEHPFFSENIFFQKNEVWKEMRQTLTPVFTSSKIKSMFPVIVQHADQFVEYVSQQKDANNCIVNEMKDLHTRIANDVIANIAFGTECNSFKDQTNEFFMMSKTIINEGVFKSFRFYAYLALPKLFHMFNISPFAKNSSQFFFDLVKTNIKHRQENNITRHDMIQILLEARSKGVSKEKSCEEIGFATPPDSAMHNISNHKTKVTNEEIASQGFSFLFAGYESVSITMSFMSYELAVNDDIQKKLIEEVDEIRKTYDGTISYEILAKMRYMDMVVSETLRKWPQAPVLSRSCNKPFVIDVKNSGEKSVLLEPGTTLYIPVFALHRDPVLFPDPEKFDPERFNKMNRKNIVSGSYIPFGDGPRSCIGSRLALLEIKVVFFKILSKFEIVPVDKTRIPLKLAKGEMPVLVDGGIWLGLKRRQSSV